MLTDVMIRKAKATARTQRLWDAGGLYLEVSPKGGRWWRLKYRVGQAGARREKRLSLGVYPDVGLAKARLLRDEARADLAAGIDPSAKRKAAPSAGGVAPNPFGGISAEWVAVHAPGWATSHAVTVTARLKNDILPFIGETAVAELGAPAVLDVLRRIEARGAGETARRCKTIIGQVCKYAVATGRASLDPTASLGRGVLVPVRVKHHAAPLDPADIGRILRALAGYKGSPIVRAALALGPLTFVRPGELRQARWADIDLEAGTWSFASSKTDQPHLVPLSRQAVAVLRELHPLTGTGPWVFSGRDPARPMSNNSVLAAMRRCDIGNDELTGHGWRATARTLLVERLGFKPEVVELQLAHAVRDPLGRAYNRVEWLDQRRAMMQRWADWLGALRDSDAPTG